MEPLGVHFVIFYFVGANGEESAEADVESEIFDDYTFLTKLFEEFLGHIEAGGGSSGGAHVLGPDGLIALRVIFVGVAVEVGRQGNSAVFFGEVRERNARGNFGDAITQHVSNGNAFSERSLAPVEQSSSASQGAVVTGLSRSVLATSASMLLESIIIAHCQPIAIVEFAAVHYFLGFVAVSFENDKFAFSAIGKRSKKS